MPSASASAFLRQKSEGELQRVALEIVERTLLSELSVNSDRLRGFEDELRAMYVALPKNEHGTLEPAAVRYALHRYFVQKHGWYVKGLEPAGQGWNTSAPTDIMKSRIPTYIQSLFEKRLHGQGMGLHDLAVFAATILDLVHNEGLTDVMELYAAFNLSTTSPAPKSDVDDVVKAYTLQHLGSSPIDSRISMRLAEQYMVEDFPAWGEFQLWVEDVRQTISMQRSRSSFHVEGFTVGSVVEEVQELNDRLGAFQDIECRSLKAGLEDLQYKDTGRVLLSDFYRAGMRGDFLFNENVDFLRQFGVLDESDNRHPSVIIANYLASQANCLASTSFHSVCCIDECEGLIGHLERAIAGPRASPGRIAELVARMRSDTVDAPRNLSASLLTRLGEIADHHHGLVPLHGRLFAQWMHHAYPLECPYPHSAGTVSPLTADEWMEQAGAGEVAASAADRSHFIQQAELAAQVAAQASSEALPWTMKEELLVRHERQQAGQEGYQMLRKVAALLAVLALAVPMARASAASLYFTSGAKLEKCHFV